MYLFAILKAFKQFFKRLFKGSTQLDALEERLKKKEARLKLLKRRQRS